MANGPGRPSIYVIDGSGAKRNSGLRATAADWRSQSLKAVIWAGENCRLFEKCSGIVELVVG